MKWKVAQTFRFDAPVEKVVRFILGDEDSREFWYDDGTFAYHVWLTDVYAAGSKATRRLDALDFQIADTNTVDWQPVGWEDREETDYLLYADSDAGVVSIVLNQVGGDTIGELWLNYDLADWVFSSDSKLAFTKGTEYLAGLWQKITTQWLERRATTKQPDQQPAQPDGPAQSGGAADGAELASNGTIATMPPYHVLKQHFPDYCNETGQKILELLPAAYRIYETEGGHWGASCWASLIQLRRETVTRYLTTFKKAGLTTWKGIALP